MIDISVSEFRRHLPRYLKAAQAGEAVTITHRGTPIAELHCAPDRERSAASRLAALRKRAFIGDVISPVDETWDAERDCP